MGNAPDSEVILRLEGVNLDAIVEDTQDLSTARGGSLLLLNVVAAVGKCLELAHAGGRLTAEPRLLSRGASIGVFDLRLAEGVVPSELRSDVEGWLGGEQLPAAIDDESRELLRLARHATFVVDVLPVHGAGVPDNPKSAILEAAVAANRLRRLQSVSLVYPRAEPERLVPGNPAEIEALICAESLVAPALASQRTSEVRRGPMSQSVLERRSYGRDLKSGFYWEVLNDIVPPESLPRAYAQDLTDIATLAEGEVDGLAPEPRRRMGRLDGTMAVFYADGNGFTKHQRAYIEARSAGGRWQDALAEWDGKLRGWRADLLAALLRGMDASGPLATRPRSKVPGDTLLRLETLLWGGWW